MAKNIVLKKSSYLVIIFLLLISFVSAQQVKISPAKIQFNLSKYEQKCETVWIYPDVETEVNLFLSREFHENPLQYKLSPEQTGILFSYKRLEFGEYKICFQATKSGRYFGATKFSSKDSLIVAGNWIELNVKGTDFNALTGNVVAEIGEKNYDLWFMLISLVGILGLLIFSFFRKRKYLD